MNVLDFNILPGWPASTETWQFLQNMILQVQQVSLIGGTNYIVSGCLDTGGIVSNGIVVVNGEPFPFIGGPVQPNVVIVDTPTKREFFGGVQNNYYHERTATFGSGSGAVAWSSFKRNDPANGVLSRLEKVEKMLKPLMGYTAGGATVYGSWLFWGRPASEIPAGWEAVPDDADWKGKVPVVLDATQVEFNEVGKTGGAKTHTLLRQELPHFQLQVNTGDQQGRSDNANDRDVMIPGNSTKNTDYLGDGLAHNNLQPYRVVMFIRFVG